MGAWGDSFGPCEGGGITFIDSFDVNYIIPVMSIGIINNGKIIDIEKTSNELTINTVPKVFNIDIASNINSIDIEESVLTIEYELEENNI